MEHEDKITALINSADSGVAAIYAILAIKRIGELGPEAGEAFLRLQEPLAGDDDYENGFNMING